MTDLDEFDDTSTFENKAGLADDMRFLASIPEVEDIQDPPVFILHPPTQLTDITFLVGDTREPVCAVRAVLAARFLASWLLATSFSLVFWTSLLTTWPSFSFFCLVTFSLIIWLCLISLTAN